MSVPVGLGGVWLRVAELLTGQVLDGLWDSGLEVVDRHPSRRDVDPRHLVVERVHAGFPLRKLVGRRDLPSAGDVLGEDTVDQAITQL